VTISPNNPSGAVYPEETLRAVNELCRERGLYHIHDEAYEYFTYDGAHHFSPGSIEKSAGHTISLYSFSKAYGFASWRIGYMVFPKALLASIKKIQDTILICPPVVSQYAALGAYQAGRTWCDERIQGISKVRSRVLNELEGLGELGRVPRADGAFYFLLRLETDWSPDELVEQLIREYRVAAIPGSAFGMTGGCTLRVAYGALKPDTAAEGADHVARRLEVMMTELVEANLNFKPNIQVTTVPVDEVDSLDELVERAESDDATG
jgi:aspartate/methionine/tyrosine aminotransferase